MWPGSLLPDAAPEAEPDPQRCGTPPPARQQPSLQPGSVRCWIGVMSLCEQPYSQGQLDVGPVQWFYVNNLTARVS